MPYIDVDISDCVQADVDIDDFLGACNSKDIKYIIECLKEDGHLEDSDLFENSTELDKSLLKIMNSQIQLTIEEETIIKNIATRLV
jgi:hypothetical protein